MTERILIRDVEPVTPCGLLPKVIAGDDVEVTAQLVADGHDVLAAIVRWAAVPADQVDMHTSARVEPGSPFWSSAVMDVTESGYGSASVVFPSVGSYVFQILAFRDGFATWRRDLLRRHEAGEDLSVEYSEGAVILKDLAGSITDRRDLKLVNSALSTLSSATCSDATKLRAALQPDLLTATRSLLPSVGVTACDYHPIRVDRELGAFGAWYELFPRSEGGFVAGSRIWKRLDAVAEAGFDVLYLPPIHPIGVTNRKGRDNSIVAASDDVGSPWAIGSRAGGHDALDPDLGEISDFKAFVGRADEIGVQIALDYALQCSPDHPWVSEHPEWFSHRVDGSIRYAENPPKKYQDIYPLNFWPSDDRDRVALWEACLDILVTWMNHGVSVFRVDNPHTKPLSFWRWIIAAAQRKDPNVVFLSEAFTDPPMMHSLAEIGFTQSYTYFTWRHNKEELTSYGTELAHGSESGWFRPNLWPSTPDILTGQLRNGTSEAFQMRAVLAATMAPSWGLYSGYELCEGDPHPTKEEYHNSEKYELKERNHDDPSSIWPLITRLNQIRRRNKAFQRMDSLHFHTTDHDSVIAYSHVRLVEGVWNRMLIVVNLEPNSASEAMVYIDRHALELSDGGPITVHDELTGESWNWSGYGDYVRLDPGERVAHIFRVDYGLH